MYPQSYPNFCSFQRIAANDYERDKGDIWQFYVDCNDRNGLGRTSANGGGGASGRDRTTDTAIFSRMLYQLSYRGIRRGASLRCQEARL